MGSGEQPGAHRFGKSERIMLRLWTKVVSDKMDMAKIQEQKLPCMATPWGPEDISEVKQPL